MRKTVMPYPDEIVADIQSKYHLSKSLEEQLKASLMTEGVKNTIEEKLINPEHLVINDSGSGYTSIISPFMMKKASENKALIDEYRAWVIKNIESLKKWEELRIDLKKVEDIPKSKGKYRAIAAKELLPKLSALSEFIQGSRALLEEYLYISKELSQYINLETLPIQVATSAYFKKFYAENGKQVLDIQFTPKKSGIQLGTTMKLTYEEKVANKDSEGTKNESKADHRKVTVSYFIKTHQHGSTSKEASIKPIDPKELFVYKVLEYIGYGPKAHFFFNPLSVSGFYIATQDIGFTKSATKHKQFTLFDNLKASCSTDPSAANQSDSRRAVISLDIISRAFRLKDTTTNPGNFGRVIVDSTKIKWKILDFRVPDEPDYYDNPNVFSGLEAGNGVFNYEYSAFLAYIFKNNSYQKTRMEESKVIIEELFLGRPCHLDRKMPILAAIDRAYKEILVYIEQNYEGLRIDKNSASSDLISYITAVKKNLERLKIGVSQKCQELLNNAPIATSATTVSK